MSLHAAAQSRLWSFWSHRPSSIHLTPSSLTFHSVLNSRSVSLTVLSLLFAASCCCLETCKLSESAESASARSAVLAAREWSDDPGAGAGDIEGRDASVEVMAGRRSSMISSGRAGARGENRALVRL